MLSDGYISKHRFCDLWGSLYTTACSVLKTQHRMKRQERIQHKIRPAPHLWKNADKANHPCFPRTHSNQRAHSNPMKGVASRLRGAYQGEDQRKGKLVCPEVRMQWSQACPVRALSWSQLDCSLSSPSGLPLSLSSPSGPPPLFQLLMEDPEFLLHWILCSHCWDA